MTYLLRLTPPPMLGTLMLVVTVLLCPVIVAVVVLTSLLRDTPGMGRAKRGTRQLSKPISFKF